MDMDFDKGDRVMTHLGAGTVVFKRMAPPTYAEVEVYSVCLDSKKKESESPPFNTYTGTIIKPGDVKPEVGETVEQWEARHKGHVTEEWTPARPFEDRSLHCHDCNESAEWKGKKKL